MQNSTNLAFLEQYLVSRNTLYRKSKWLLSDFDKDIWSFKFEATNIGSFIIDWNVNLSNGTVLTDNRRLLDTFKFWITAALHPDNNSGRGLGYADATAKLIISKVLYLIDYFLLNDTHLNVSTFGLEVLNLEDLNMFSDCYRKKKLAAEHIYGWSTKLSEFISGNLTNSNLRNSLNQTVFHHEIEVVTDQQVMENTLSIPIELIPLARKWLWQQGFYRTSYLGEYNFVLNTTKMAEMMYSRTTLRGVSSTKNSPSILNFGLPKQFKTEYKRVQIAKGNENNISFTNENAYFSAFKALLLLNDNTFQEEKLLLPQSFILSGFLESQPLNSTFSRFETFPSMALLKCFEQAVEFHLNHSKHLIASLKKLIPLVIEKKKIKSNVQSPSFSHLVNNTEFSETLNRKTKKFGVEKWSLLKSISVFEDLRANKGLVDLIKVYFGCVQLVVGTLMARRQAELLDLKIDSCLDESNRYLLFRKAKSSKLLEGARLSVARPIDELAVEMISALIEIQNIYFHHGLIPKLGKVFDNVSYFDPLIIQKASHHSFNQNFDYFCDYFQTPLSGNRRFYIRMHQLRRFFALAFFWGSGTGGMDTLRWFLGHADPQHLYRYISENIPGEVLRSAKSQYLSETIDEHYELRELIFTKFGTYDFTILKTSEVEDYLNMLLINETIVVEPEFIDDDEGNSYKLLVQVNTQN